MSTGIIVITHNGKMPADGGQRMGYQVGNKYFPFGGPIDGILLTPPAPARPAIYFDELLFSNHIDGDCRSCQHYPNPVIEVETDKGKQNVVKCTNCGMLMKPKKRSIFF